MSSSEKDVDSASIWSQSSLPNGKGTNTTAASQGSTATGGTDQFSKVSGLLASAGKEDKTNSSTAIGKIYKRYPNSSLNHRLG